MLPQDLNRDFPDPIHRARGKGWSENLGPSGSEMPETSAVMKWSLQYNFVAGVSMHEGAVVANYPWDGSLVRPNPTTQSSPSNDDDYGNDDDDEVEAEDDGDDDEDDEDGDGDGDDEDDDDDEGDDDDDDDDGDEDGIDDDDDDG